METDVILEFYPCLHLSLCWKSMDHFQNPPRVFLSPLGETNEHLTILCVKPQGHCFICKIALFNLNFAFRHTSMF